MRCYSTSYNITIVSLKKEGCRLSTFPVELMYKHINNREAFEKLDTPFVEYYGYTCCKEKDVNNPIYKSVEKYKTDDITMPNYSLGGLRHLCHVMNKEIDRAYSNGESDDAIFGGWGGMNDYKL